MADSADQAVTAYFDNVPAERKSMVETIHQLILELYPDAVVDMKYKMPTYQVGSGWVALANQKHYVSLYTCGAHHLAAFKQQHPKIKTGKGCINFKPSAPLPLQDLQSVIRHAIDHPKIA
jgi:uncharacterized protein YdhG (YjbR/CyaY superfamily)